MSERVFNFGPGPAVLPVEALEVAQKELVNYQGTGMSILEISHRSKPFEGVLKETKDLLTELLNIPENYKILFIGMGATGQFDMVPMNFLSTGRTADYLNTGSFSVKAYKEGQKVGEVRVAGSTKETGFTRVLKQDEINIGEDSAFVHFTTNNTIEGTQWKEFPNVGDVPLIADMSSDILSKKIDVSKFALIYAGAQKNLGPAGVAVVIIRDDMLEKINETLPTMLRYDTYVKNDSLYNTPPVFAIYFINLMLNWVKGQGGMDVIEKRNEEKAGWIYDVIDQSNGFYKGHAEVDSRSLMNITFRLPSEELEKEFLAQATQLGLVGLKGHREVGGIRASIYNAMPQEGCRKLADFMKEFLGNNA